MYVFLNYVVWRVDGHNLSRWTATLRRRSANEQMTSMLHNNDDCADVVSTSLQRMSAVWGTLSTEWMGII